MKILKCSIKGDLAWAFEGAVFIFVYSHIKKGE